MTPQTIEDLSKWNQASRLAEDLGTARAKLPANVFKWTAPLPQAQKKAGAPPK